MGSGQNTFKQCDLKRAIEGVRATGEKIGRVEVGKDGKIVIVIGDDENKDHRRKAPPDDDTWS